MKSVYLQIAESASGRPGLVLATVTGTSGSTTQKPGTLALFAKGKLIAGTLGGGAVESETAIYAATCLEARESAMLHFSFGNESSLSGTKSPHCFKFLLA